MSWQQSAARPGPIHMQGRLAPAASTGALGSMLQKPLGAGVGVRSTAARQAPSPVPGGSRAPITRVNQQQQQRPGSRGVPGSSLVHGQESAIRTSKSAKELRVPPSSVSSQQGGSPPANSGGLLGERSNSSSPPPHADKRLDRALDSGVHSSPGASGSPPHGGSRATAVSLGMTPTPSAPPSTPITNPATPTVPGSLTPTRPNSLRTRTVNVPDGMMQGMTNGVHGGSPNCSVVAQQGSPNCSVVAQQGSPNSSVVAPPDLANRRFAESLAQTRSMPQLPASTGPSSTFNGLQELSHQAPMREKGEVDTPSAELLADLGPPANQQESAAERTPEAHATDGLAMEGRSMSSSASKTVTRQRSFSPTVQSKSQAEASYQRSLKERDEEILRLREQVRMAEGRIATRSPKGSFGPNPAAGDLKRLREENMKLKNRVAQLQEPLARAARGAQADTPAVSSAAQPVDAMPSANGVAGDMKVMDKGRSPNQRHKSEDMSIQDMVRSYPGSTGSSIVTAPGGQGGGGGGRGGTSSRGDSTTGNTFVGMRGSSQVHRSSPRATLSARVGQLQRQLKEKEEEAQEAHSFQDNLRAKNLRLEARCEKLREMVVASQQALPSDDDIQTSEDVAKDLEELCRGDIEVPLQAFERLVRRADMARAAKNGKKHRDQLSARRREQQRLEEELRRMEYETNQRSEQLRFEREQWRTEREVFLTDQRRREKVEDTLRRQLSSVQERLDLSQAGQTEREQERRQLLTQVQQLQLQLSEKSNAERDMREDHWLQDKALLESKVQSQQREIHQIRKKMQQVEGERADLYVRLNTLPPPKAVTKYRGHAYGFDNERNSRGRGRGSGLGRHPASAAGRRGRGFAPTHSSSGSPGGFASSGHPSPPRSLGNSPPPSQATSPMLAHRVPLNLALLRRQDEETGHYSMARSPSSISCTSSSCASSTGSSSLATETRKGSHSMQLCAVFGDAPLPKIQGVGWYFRLQINSVNTGWVGGFGIGITLSTPSLMATLPDRASRVQRSWLAGYWGRTFCNGQERLSDWKPQGLRQGDHVGFLVTIEGECVVFINDEERCRFGDPLVPVKHNPEVELTALLDIAAVPTSVTFLNGAPPPPSVMREACSRSTSPSPREMEGPMLTPSAAALAADVAAATAAASSLAQGRDDFASLAAGSPLQGPPSPRQGSYSPMPPVPPLLQLRAGGASPSYSSTAPAASTAAAAAAAARRVPPLALQQLPVN